MRTGKKRDGEFEVADYPCEEKGAGAGASANEGKVFDGADLGSWLMVDG